MDEWTAKQLCASAIGECAIMFLDTLMEGELAIMSESAAISLISQIKEILDDQSIDDPTCFMRIDAIVDAFLATGISTQRHDDLE